jgi:hypothetical protein
MNLLRTVQNESLDIMVRKERWLSLIKTADKNWSKSRTVPQTDDRYDYREREREREGRDRMVTGDADRASPPLLSSLAVGQQHMGRGWLA